MATKRLNTFWLSFSRPLIYIPALLSLVAIGWISVNALSKHYPLSYGEGILVGQSINILRGQNIYNVDISKPPFIITNYLPVFQLMQAGLFYLFGPQFLWGRLISLISFGGVLLTLFMITDRLVKSRQAAYIACLAFASNIFVLRWFFLARIDLLALLFFSLSIYFALTRYSIFVPSLFSLLAIFTRQTYLFSALFAPFLLLLCQKRKKEAILFLTNTFFFYFVLFALIYIITDGGIYFHLIQSNINEFIFGRLYSAILVVCLSLPMYFGIACVSLFISIRKISTSLVATSNEGCCILLALCLLSLPSAISFVKVGSDYNYFFEIFLVVSIAIAILYKQYQDNSFLSIIIVLLVGLQASINILSLPPFNPQAKLSSLFPLSQEKENLLKKELETIAWDQGPILSDVLLGIESIKGYSIYYQPFIMRQLAKQGIWNEDPFVQDIYRRKFPAVTITTTKDGKLEQQRWSPNMKIALDQCYQEKTRVGNISFLYPREACIFRNNS